MAPCYQTDLPDPQFTLEEIRAIWAYAKTRYIDAGVDFDSTVTGVASDLGLHPKWVTQAFTKPKVLRSITDDMFRKMSARRAAVQDAKTVVRSLASPDYVRLAKRIYQLPRSALTAGHWAVFPVTHGGDLAFRPTAWTAYFKGVFDAWRFVSPKAHEAAMHELVTDPNYITAKRGGLENDPRTDPKGILVSGMRGASRRGFDTLKIIRQKLFNQEWARTSVEDRTPEFAKELSTMINHSTGAYQGQVPFSKLQFAPKLTASKWARAVIDPAKTISTFMNWKGATAAERSIAIRRVRNAAEFAATYAGMLAINQGLDQAMGSKDKVNVTDPSRPDFLSFKVAGHVLGMGTGVREVYKFLGQLIQIGQQARKDRRGDAAAAAGGRVIGRYMLNKAEPTISVASEAVWKEDRLTGRPLPFSDDKGTSKLPRMSYGEYAGTHFAPIPLTGATREAYDSIRQRGLSALDTTALLKAAGIFATEATGVKNFDYNEPHRK